MQYSIIQFASIQSSIDTNKILVLSDKVTAKGNLK